MRITPKTSVNPLATRKSRAANVRPLRTWRARNSGDTNLPFLEAVTRSG